MKRTRSLLTIAALLTFMGFSRPVTSDATWLIGAGLDLIGQDELGEVARETGENWMIAGGTVAAIGTVLVTTGIGATVGTAGILAGSLGAAAGG